MWSECYDWFKWCFSWNLFGWVPAWPSKIHKQPAKKPPRGEFADKQSFPRYTHTLYEVTLIENFCEKLRTEGKTITPEVIRETFSLLSQLRYADMHFEEIKKSVADCIKMQKNLLFQRILCFKASPMFGLSFFSGYWQGCPRETGKLRNSAKGKVRRPPFHFQQD